MTTLGRRDWFMLFGIWLIVQIGFLSYFGIYAKEEALVYINIANELVNGNFSHSIHYWLYAGYIAPLTVIRRLGLPADAMYVVQLCISFLGMLAFIKLLISSNLSRMAILVGGILFASSPFFHSWNSHLYTDALFGNLVILITLLIYRCASGTNTQFLLLALCLFAVCFFRPVGFLLILIACLHLIFSKGPAWRLIVLSGLFVLSALFVKFTLKHGTDFFYPNHNLELNVICGLPGDLKQYENVAFREGMSIPGYFWSNPKLTVHLFAERLWKTLWMTRPYFSLRHNIGTAALCLIYNLLAIAGLFYVLKRKITNSYYIISGLVIWLIPNIVFCADWHNRFIIPFIPYLLILATFGIEWMYFMQKRSRIK